VNAVVFIGALALAVIALEIGTALQGKLYWHSKLAGASVAGAATAPRRSTWEALLMAIFPSRFDPNREATNTNVIDMLRRAGYPYSTPGEFYAAAIKYFTVYLTAGAITAGVVAMLGLGIAAPFLAGAFIFMGLSRPYANLRSLAKKRAEAMRNNMLIGLAVFESLLAAGQGVQEALRDASRVGGPFCNLMGLLVARLEIESADKAIATTRAHIPDPDDVDMQLFLRDVSDFFLNSRAILESITALRTSVHRNILEATERRASVVLQRTSLFGIFAVVGLILSIILPFMNM
jgi:Flp pilus assembly protein TadB